MAGFRIPIAACSLMLVAPQAFAAGLSISRSGVDFSVDSATEAIDPARSVFVTVKAVAPNGLAVTMPDIGSRLRGFSAAEEFAEEPVEADGRTTQVVSWKLVPEPCADEYKIRPFVVAVAKGAADLSFAAGPVYFRNPADRERAEGGIEVDPEKDLPPLSWRLVGWIALAVLAAALVFAAAFFAVRYLSRRVKEHFMSPIERAWAELGRLLAKGLPGRGRYKDFYVELTMVVRRYVQRRYGIRAPHLTTEEFLRELGSSGRTDRAKLAEFLENADLVKFAGIEATTEMADQATGSARDYLRSDSAIDGRGGGR